MLDRLDDDDTRPLTHDEAVAVPVVGARGLLRFVIEARREGPAGGKAGHCEPADRALGAASHHDVGIAEHDEPRRIADGVRARRAGGDDSVVGPLEAMLDGDVAGREIDEPAWNEERD